MKDGKNTKSCIFACKVVVGGGEGFLLYVAVVVAVVPNVIDSFPVFCN